MSDKRMPQHVPARGWGASLVAVCIAQASAIAGFDFTLPFIPLYLQHDMGVHGLASTALWSGLISFAPAIPATVCAPLWGRLADRLGYRAMLLRAMLCSAVLLGLMGLAPSPLILLVLRMVQGGLSGTVFAAQALVAATSPEEDVARSMGYLQMAVYVGATMGPIGGGAVAETLGYRAAFAAAGILLATGGAVVFALVREPKRRTPRRTLDTAGRPSLRSVLLIPAFTAALIFTLIVQLASTAMLPLVPLYVQELLHSGRSVAADTGWLMALSGIFAAAGSYWCGRLSRHIGLTPLLLSTAVLSAALIAPQAFAGSFVAFLLMRSVAALAFGGLWSLVGAWAAMASPRDAKGAAFGLMGAASSLGFGSGPLLGGALAAATGIRPVFLISACLVGLMPILFIGLSSVLPALHGIDTRARNARRLQPEAE